MNKVIMMGRITRDIEVKQSGAGNVYCKFGIAVDRAYSKSTEKKTDFFNVSAWRNTAEFVGKNFHKGSLILIEGSIETSQYTDKNGNAATWYEIVADKVHFTGEKSVASANAASSGNDSVNEPYPF